MARSHGIARLSARKFSPRIQFLILANFAALAGFLASAPLARAQTPSYQHSVANLLPFSVSDWTPTPDATLTRNDILEPNGQPGAARITVTANNGGASSPVPFRMGVGLPYTCSAEFRLVEGNQYFGLWLPNSIFYGGSSTARGVSLLVNGQTGKAFPSGSLTSYEVRPRPAGWVNLSITFVPTTTTMANLRVFSPTPTSFVFNNVQCEQWDHPSGVIGMSETGAPTSGLNGSIMPLDSENSFGSYQSSGFQSPPVQNVIGLDGLTSAWTLPLAVNAYLNSPSVVAVNNSATANAPYWATAYFAKKTTQGTQAYPGLCIFERGTDASTTLFQNECVQVDEVTGAVYSMAQQNFYGVADAGKFWKVWVVLNVPPTQLVYLNARIYPAAGFTDFIMPSSGSPIQANATPTVATTVDIGPALASTGFAP